jgi:colanic acid/amylovoran biosynthesis protein
VKILILWADHHSGNLGIQALARGTEAVVRRVWPEADVDVEVHTPGPWPRFVPALSFARAWVGGDRAERARLSAYDLVIDTGSGDSFADIYGMRRLLQMSCTRASAVRAGRTVLMGPQTVGPFETGAGRRVARASLRGVKQVIARDTESAGYARATLGRDAALATDVVFAIPRPEIAQTRGVIFNVSGLLWNENPHVDHLKYRRETVDFLRRLQEHDIPFSLLTHVVGEDDAAVAAVAEALGGAVEQLVPGDVLEARALIASGRLTIGARMHACLNSLSIGVPALPWAYSRKFEPLMRDLSWPHLVDLRTQPDVAERSWSIATALLDGAASADLAALAELAEARLQVAAETIRTAHG